jgi:LacI family transcriptional regulator
MTVREIAGLAGVSIGTVDRVLYKRGRVAPETRARVEEIIERYQFTPNPIARRLKRNRAYHFCVLLPNRDQDAGYWGLALQGMQQAAEEIASLGVKTEIIEFDRYRQKEFRAAADAILGMKPDGLILSPIMPDRTKPFIEEIRQADIPCIFFDADMPGMEPICAVGQDSFRGGYLAGRLMRLFAGDIKKPVAILDAHGEDYHIIRRREGFLQYAREYRFPTLVQEYSDYKGAEISVEEIDSFLRAHPDITGVFITNSMAHRVSEALKNRPPPRDILLIGYDLIPNNRLSLEEGWIDAVISQRPEYQGRESLLNLYRRIVLNQQIPPRVEIPLDVYFKENIPS